MDKRIQTLKCVMVSSVSKSKYRLFSDIDWPSFQNKIQQESFLFFFISWNPYHAITIVQSTTVQTNKAYEMVIGSGGKPTLTYVNIWGSWECIWSCPCSNSMANNNANIYKEKEKPPHLPSPSQPPQICVFLTSHLQVGESVSQCWYWFPWTQKTMRNVGVLSKLKKKRKILSQCIISVLHPQSREEHVILLFLKWLIASSQDMVSSHCRNPLVF